MALTDTFVRQVKHSGAPAGDKHTDGQGMFLLFGYRKLSTPKLNLLEDMNSPICFAHWRD